MKNPRIVITLKGKDIPGNYPTIFNKNLAARLQDMVCLVGTSIGRKYASYSWTIDVCEKSND